MNIPQILKRHRALTWAGAGLVALLSLVGLFSATQKVAPVAWGWFGDINSQGELALQGYDPVSYGQGQAHPGQSAIVASYQGLRFQFASEENRARFESAPDDFLPTFGGYCAFAVSKGFTADVDPTVVYVKDDKVLLFHDESVKQDFIAEEAENLEAASVNWAAR
jgi:YHS domain-containing protein